MPIDRKLMDILCCPATKVPLQPLTRDRLERLNQRIDERRILYVDGSVVDNRLDEGLITQTGTTIYRVDDDIPIMLEERGIPADQLDEP